MKYDVNKRGFSIVELLAALTASSMVAITAGIILFYAYRAWNDNKSTVERQQDGSVAMAFLAKALRDATSAVCIPADTLEIGATNGLRRFSVENNFLYYKPNPSAERMLITSNVAVAGFVCSNVTGGVKVTLALETRNGKAAQETVIHLRN